MHGNLPSAVGAFLVRTADRLMLVDAGGGSFESHAHRSVYQPNVELRATLSDAVSTGLRASEDGSSLEPIDATVRRAGVPKSEEVEHGRQRTAS